MILVGHVDNSAFYAPRGQLTVVLEHGATCSDCGEKMRAGIQAVLVWGKKRTDLRHQTGCVADPPAQRHSAPSIAAAAAITPATPNLRERVLHMLRVQGPATDEEGSERLGMALNTFRPRRIELVAAGAVRDAGSTRRTHAGRQATVWEAVE